VVLLHFSYRPLKEYYEVRLMEKAEINCHPSNETVMVASKEREPWFVIFHKLPQFPQLNIIEGKAHNLLTTKSHSRSIIQLNHPFWRLQTTRLTSKNLFKYQICPIVIATRTRASKKLHITTRELVFSLMAR